MSEYPDRPVTTADIAEQLGLSQSTVSIVLRGEAKKRRISSETAERVLATARKLNYSANLWARNLRQQRSSMIGVILVSLRWDWAQIAVQGMTEVLHPRGYMPFVAIHNFDDKRCRRELESCLKRRDAGIIMQPMPGMAELYERIDGAGIPLVFLGDVPGDAEQANYVAWDSTEGARRAVEHLIDTGRRRIGFFGFDYPMPLNRARYETYLDVLKQAGLMPQEHWVARAPLSWALDLIPDWCVSRMFDPQREPPDAIFALNDGLALPLLHALKVRGIRVPEDVAVVGMGDCPMAGHLSVGLSTIVEPVAEMGRQIARVVTELVDSPSGAAIQQLVPGGELKVRGTTAPRASRGNEEE